MLSGIGQMTPSGSRYIQPQRDGTFLCPSDLIRLDELQYFNYPAFTLRSTPRSFSTTVQPRIYHSLRLLYKLAGGPSFTPSNFYVPLDLYPSSRRHEHLLWSEWQIQEPTAVM
jgi:hypothetical protein